MKRVLLARQDNNGDVLLVGPAVRAVAAHARVTMLCGPRGAAAARLLPGVDEVIIQEAQWIDAEPSAVDSAAVLRFVSDLGRLRFDEAIIFTSFHQSPLPLALLLRMARVPRIGAISVDYPGSLLDVRHHVDEDIHEVQRALSLVHAMGYALPREDDCSLQLGDLPDMATPFDSYVVVHPGCTVPARAWSSERNAQLVERLTAAGQNVVVTGSSAERDLTAYVCGDSHRSADFGGKTSFAEFAALVRDARAVVCGNTAAAHVAAATKTPVVELFPPTVPAVRFRPWMVPYVLLGDQEISCRGCRARRCPLESQRCLDAVSPDDVLAAVTRIARPPMRVYA